MGYKVELISERETELGVVGKVLRRTYEVSDVRNTMGEQEVYRVVLNGQYDGGTVRYDVLVQRKNGSFAMLDSNRHQQRRSQVFSALADVLLEYKAANQAYRAR